MEKTNSINCCPTFERQYQQALINLLNLGKVQSNRTGIDTLVQQHAYFYLKDIKNNFPIIKGKKVYPKMSFKELTWFILGRNDIKWLTERGVTYWNEWAANKNDEEIKGIKEGTIGKSYGYQFRNFNGADNFINIVKELAANPSSRRAVLNLWNIADINEMTIPPCVYDFHFSTTKVHTYENRYYLDLHIKSRSQDSFLGLPYDFMQGGWLLLLMEKILNNYQNFHKFEARDIHYTADDFHLYVNHKEQAEQYISNVFENKNNIIDTAFNFSIESDDKLIKNIKNHNIDDAIKTIDESNYSILNVLDYKNNLKLIYDEIKAPIAI